MSFGDTKTIVTPEQVRVSYTLAGVGTRFAAILLDTCLQLAVLLALWLGVFGLGWSLDFRDLAQRLSAWLLALLGLLSFAVLWGYFLFWETVWNGQTPGKRAAGIRVMRDTGYPVDFRAAFIRNVVRIADFLPTFYGVGALCVFISKDSRRLGDYAAGTIVVMDAGAAPRHLAVPPAVRPTAVYPALGDPAVLNLRALSREQFAVAERFLMRRAELRPEVRSDLARKITASIMPVIGATLPADGGVPYTVFPYEQFLEDLVSAYRELADR